MYLAQAFKSSDYVLCDLDEPWTKSFERVPGAALVTQLLTTPLLVTVYKGEEPFATASVDLSPFAEGASEVVGDAVALTPLTTPAAAAAEGEGDAAAAADPSTTLLSSAAVAVSVTPSEPLMTPEEAAAGCVLTLEVSKVSPVPESLVAVSAASDAPFTFTAGMPLAGIAPAGSWSSHTARKARLISFSSRFFHIQFLINQREITCVKITCIRIRTCQSSAL